MEKEKIIYQLSVEGIFTAVEDNNLNLQFSETDIPFIEEKVGNYIDWRRAIEYALLELQSYRGR